jgi:hypothetical protein
MSREPRHVFHVAPRHQPLVREVGIDAEAAFERDDIVAWRKLPDRENCTLDAPRADGSTARLHIKRYLQPHRGAGPTPAEMEARGYQALERAGIPSVDVVGWGRLADGRSCFVTLDLAGYDAADKLIGRGVTTFVKLLTPTADLAAKLHEANLHHRDLYLCHFFAKSSPVEDPGVRLIDAARVGRLGSFLTRGRWIVKDLAQFWYSTLALPATDDQRRAWLARYAQRRRLKPAEVDRLRKAIERKVKWIARHDAGLRAKQPTRNISIAH